MHRSTTPSARPSNRRRAFLGSLIGLALIGVSAVPARATIYEKDAPYTVSRDDGVFDACGVTVHHTVTYSGRIMIRTGKGDLAGAFFAHDQFSYLETWTNAAVGTQSEGKFFTISGSYLSQDVRATHISGSIFQFVTHQVGQPYVVRNMAGTVVLRDRGSLTLTYLFDTLGDSVPGGIDIGDLSLRVSGPHPGYFLDPAAQCQALVSLIG